MDSALIARARDGDREAMEQLLESIAPTIKRFALRMCRNEADADDVLQDALLSIATHLGDFEGRSSLPSWTFALTRSACSRRRRGQKNRPHDAVDTLEQQPASDPGPHEHAESAEHAALVESALRRLPDDYREVLLLRDGEGLTAPEVASVLGVTVDALKSRLHRARSALRDELRPVLERAEPTKSGCPDVVRALSRKLEGELDADACAEMESHIETCGACARACDDLRSALSACRSTSGTELTPAVRDRVKTTLSRWINAQR